MKNTLMTNKKLLLIIDVQNNFINHNTKNIPLKIKKLIKKNKFDYIAYTKFINDINSRFYKVLNYKGCIRDYDRKIVLDTGDNKIFNKKIYSAVNDEFKTYIKENDINSIFLCGIDTDACVLKTAVDLFENNIDVKVIEHCCMSHSGKKYHHYAIKMLKKLIGKDNII